MVVRGERRISIGLEDLNELGRSRRPSYTSRSSPGMSSRGRGVWRRISPIPVRRIQEVNPFVRSAVFLQVFSTQTWARPAMSYSGWRLGW